MKDIYFTGKMADFEKSLQEDMKELKNQMSLLLKEMETLSKKKENMDETQTEETREMNMVREDSVNSV